MANNSKTIIPKSKNEMKRNISEITPYHNAKTFENQNAEQITNVLSAYVSNLSALLGSDKRASRVIQVLGTVIKRNPELMKCSISSLIGGMLQFAMLDLDPNPALGMAYLVPFRSKNGTTDAQFQLGYRGMVALAQRSGEIVDIYANVVYQDDTFNVEYGLNRTLQHIPDFNSELLDNKITFSYAVAKTKTGGIYFTILTRKEIENLRQRSPMQRNGLNGAWRTDYAGMAKAKALKQLAKLLPMTTDYEYSVFTDGMVFKSSNYETKDIESYDPEYVVN